MKVVRTIASFLLGAGVAVVGASSAQATTLFEDNFNNEVSGNGRTTLTKWNITAGNVDVYTPYAGLGQGKSLDMDGTPAVNATIETKDLLELAAGTYELSFKIGNNTFAGNSLFVQLGSVYSNSFNATSTLTSITQSFTVTAPTKARLLFSEKGKADWGGSVLDDVKLVQTQATPVPTPALLPGLIGMGVAALRKKGKQEPVEQEA